MDAASWMRSFVAASGGASLTDEEVGTILELAGVAAHASERVAAPLTCWLAATAGLSPASALALARSLASEAANGEDESAER
jgi:uncharacterized protein DUF6457